MTNPPASPGPKLTSATRWPAIDALRGAALVAMIVYHFMWDLSFYRFIMTDIARDPFWSRVAMAIAASFLFLVGVGFAFASRDGLHRVSYLRRLAMIAGAAMLTTLVTSFTTPHAPVLFGILHCIALTSMLIVMFLHAPRWIVLAAAAAALLLPSFARSPVFDGPLFVWLGLAQTNPPMVDHAPILPWMGFALFGLAVGRFILMDERAIALRERLRAWAPANGAMRGLALMGRWSLVIYLVHQPIMMAALWPLAPKAPAPPAAIVDETTGFRAACEQTCRANAGGADACKTYCDCAIRELRPSPLWSSILRDRVTPEEQIRIGEATRICLPARP